MTRPLPELLAAIYGLDMRGLAAVQAAIAGRIAELAVDGPEPAPDDRLGLPHRGRKRVVPFKVLEKMKKAELR